MSLVGFIKINGSSLRVTIVNRIISKSSNQTIYTGLLLGVGRNESLKLALSSKTSVLHAPLFKFVWHLWGIGVLISTKKKDHGVNFVTVASFFQVKGRLDWFIIVGHVAIPDGDARTFAWIFCNFYFLFYTEWVAFACSRISQKYRRKLQV